MTRIASAVSLMILSVASTSLAQTDREQSQQTSNQVGSRSNFATEWVTEISVGRFRVHCDFKLDPGDPLILELRRVAEEVEELLEMPIGHQTIHVVLFQTAHEYSRYMEAYFPKLPKRRALFIQDRGPGMLFAHWHPDVAADLRHEVAHAVVNRSQRPLPLWIDEGLAEYFEVPTQQRLAGSRYHSAIRKLNDRNGVSDLATLQKIVQLDHFSDEHYRDSWAWVHFMIHRSPSTRQLLIRYLREQSHYSASFDLHKALASQIPNLRHEFEMHFNEAVETARGNGDR